MQTPHPRVPDDYLVADWYDMPLRMRNLVHTCGNYSAWDASVKDGGPPKCKNCKGIVPWFVHKCIKCDTIFIRDFRHPKFCHFYPTCWEHTLSLEWTHCPTHTGDPATREWYAQIIPPSGLNPIERELIDTPDAPIFKL